MWRDLPHTPFTSLVKYPQELQYGVTAIQFEVPGTQLEEILGFFWGGLGRRMYGTVFPGF